MRLRERELRQASSNDRQRRKKRSQEAESVANAVQRDCTRVGERESQVPVGR